MRLSQMPIGLPLAVALLAATTAPIAVDARTTVRHAPTPHPTARATMAASSMVELNTGRGRLVTLAQPMTDLFVANPDVADVQVRSPTQLYIYGKQGGETTVSATAKNGSVVFSATVRVGNNFDSIGRMLGLAMPEAHIVSTPMNGLVLLTGTVAGPGDAAEAERLVQAYVGDTVKVLSRLKTATPLQVNLQVRIAEVSRSFVKNIGNSLQSFDNTSGFKFGLAQGAAATQYNPKYTAPNGLFVGGSTPTTGNTGIASPVSGTTLGLGGKLLGLDLLSAIQLGETDGQVSMLAQPNLTTLSGETASFLAGGEIPIPISQGLGAVSVEYKQYGISLSYTPTVLSDGRISLRVRPEVSQLSSAGAVTLNGTQIPALTTRRAETTLELGSGESMVIGGLISNDNANSIDKAPGLGDIPILGAAFRSNAFKRNETELMIVITPYLVRPVRNPSDIVLPTDGSRAPTDLGRVFKGDLGGGVTGAKRPVPTMAPDASPGSIGAAAPVLPLPKPTAFADPSPQAIVPKKGQPAAMPGFSE